VEELGYLNVWWSSTVVGTEIEELQYLAQRRYPFAEEGVAYNDPHKKLVF
jgi:hypothetical protein